MSKIEDTTRANIAVTGNAKRGGAHVLQELWTIKSQLNRDANYDVATYMDSSFFASN